MDLVQSSWSSYSQNTRKSSTLAHKFPLVKESTLFSGVIRIFSFTLVHKFYVENENSSSFVRKLVSLVK